MSMKTSETLRHLAFYLKERARRKEVKLFKERLYLSQLPNQGKLKKTGLRIQGVLTT